MPLVWADPFLLSCVGDAAVAYLAMACAEHSSLRYLGKLVSPLRRQAGRVDRSCCSIVFAYHYGAPGFLPENPPLRIAFFSEYGDIHVYP